MKIRFKHILITLCIIAFGYSAEAQIPKNVILGLKSGNEEMLSEYFNSTIELAVREKEGVYSKAQAQQIIREFFTNNQPSKFTIHHQGGKEQARFAIGNLDTKAGKYRVYFLIKTKEESQKIYQLRFEQE